MSVDSTWLAQLIGCSHENAELGSFFRTVLQNVLVLGWLTTDWCLRATCFFPLLYIAGNILSEKGPKLKCGQPQS